MQETTVFHNIDPIYNGESKILILGSFPSVKSREGQFFYDHPQNRFWKVLARVLSCELPRTHTQKKAFLLDNHIALWDVLQSCEIIGSSDSSIEKAVPNDLTVIFNSAPIEAIFCNGAASFEYYKRFHSGANELSVTKLPSTSPANASFSLERLVEHWSAISAYL